MAIDTKSILARADEALGLAEKASQQGPRRVDPCALIPQLAADVRELVGEVEKLTNKLSNVHANLTRAEEDRDDALTWIERCVDQTRRAEKAEARVKELLDEASLAAEALDDMTIGNAKSIDRAEKAEARVKELEAKNLDLADADEQLHAARAQINATSEDVVNDIIYLQERCEETEARLAVAVEALAHIVYTYSSLQSYAPLWLSKARAALDKVREGQS